MDIDPVRRNKKPRLLLESERERLDEFIDSIHYSARYGIDMIRYDLGGCILFWGICFFFIDSVQLFRW